jgi:hypothetical protein
MTSPALPRRRLKAYLTLTLILILAAAAFFYLSPETPLKYPDQATPQITQALLKHYQSEQSIAALRDSSTALDQARNLALTQPQAKPTQDTVTFTVVKTSQSKTRKRLLITVRPSFNNGPPPDGVPERTVTLAESSPGEWEVQPILPSGAPALKE